MPEQPVAETQAAAPRRPPTPEERTRLRRAIAEEEAAIPTNSRRAARKLDAYERGLVDTLRKTGVVDLSAAVGALKAAREARGLTLAQVSAASGIRVPALSLLENGRNGNPTLRTLQRYAAAVGLRFVVGLVDA